MGLWAVWQGCIDEGAKRICPLASGAAICKKIEQHDALAS
jgi:hypothetical protein